jgi:regulator of replication initiation timing
MSLNRARYCCSNCGLPGHNKNSDECPDKIRQIEVYRTLQRNYFSKVQEISAIKQEVTHLRHENQRLRNENIELHENRLFDKDEYYMQLESLKQDYQQRINSEKSEKELALEFIRYLTSQQRP